MLKAHVFFAWDFGVQFDKLTVRAVTEPVEVQSNAENDSVAVVSLTLASSLPLRYRYGFASRASRIGKTAG
jgi:hypothetical protein